MPVKSLKFRQKIVLLALALVIAVQSVTLFFVLTVFERESENGMRRSVSLAGAVFDEYFSNRGRQLQTAAAVLVSDFGFRGAVATREPETIGSMLRNHSARIDADVGLLVDPEGRLIASTFESPVDGIAPEDVARVFALLDQGYDAVVTIGGQAFQVVGATIRAPLPLARVLIGFEIDSALVRHLRSITGLDVTFFGSNGESVGSYASTLPDEARVAAIRDLDLSLAGSASALEMLQSNATHLSLVRALESGDQPVYAALQLSVDEATQSYRNIQKVLLAICLVSIAAALGGSFLVGRMVTRPVDRLTSAVRRMGQGDYSGRVDLRTNDEFGELAEGFNSMQRAIADRQQQIVHAASHDSLTGLPNRECILERLEEAMSTGQQVAVANLSVLRLHKLIASLGYALSDKLISRIAAVLDACLDQKHVLGCLGSGEFVIAFFDADDTEIERTLQSLRRALEEEIRIEGTAYSLRMRAGVAAATSAEFGSPAAMLYGASIARMEAENQHESCVYYEHGQEERAIRQTRLLGEFFDACEHDQLEVFFQPKVLCRTGEVCGAEALVRWRHPELGLLSPGEFVETIEKAGGISRLTRWMIRRALGECRAWRDAGFEFGVSVNISADDLLDENLPYFLHQEISARRIGASVLTLEVTESAIMHNLSRALSVIGCIHELGFRLSIDDFGTGHSSLAQLRRLPVDELKIDRSFLRDMQDSRDVSIVLATIEMASGLGLDVCAEGIENQSLLPTLDGMGARYGQGHAISQPMPRGEFIDWCRSYRPYTAVAPESSDEPTAVPRLPARSARA